MEIAKYHDFALKIAKKAGRILLDYFHGKIQINYKQGNKKNLVTEVDYMSEKLIVSAIKKEFPDHCVLSEEGGDCGIKASQYRWIIDPIDGTTNYAHGYSFYAISIALVKNDDLLTGVIYAPSLKEMFHCAKDKGAYLNDKKITVSATKKVETALLSTGFNVHEKGRNLPIFEYILPKAQGIRRAGSAALDLAYTAAGRLDGYWEYAINLWDIAAGVLLVKEAGGKISSIRGESLNLKDAKLIHVLATNGKIHKEMLEAIGAAMKNTLIARTKLF